ncbi:hypothetical protein [Pontibacter vulgaris]|uniref:hypothetical protein n=1 Tax=Pontibacter vulgaris TaxID=2905679 RepID=UPI001FA8170B|nr:hypothetical protein [Pontibacter vulgaris]
MHRFILTLLLFAGFAQMATAQREFANIDLPMRRAEDLVSVADEKSGNVCVYFFQSSRLYFNLISPSGQLIASQEIPYRWSEQPQIMGTRVTDDEFIFYSRFVNGRREFVRPFAVNRLDGKFRTLPDMELKKDKGEYFMGGFADADYFYMLYADKKENLHLYRDDQEARMTKKTFSPKLPRTRDRYDRERDLIFVHPNLERTVIAGHHRSKIYTRGDKILMVFDGFRLKGQGDKATTEILTLDWNTGQTNYRNLPAIEQNGDPEFNSFLHQNTLFRLQLDKDKLNLTAYDFATLQPVKTYNFSGDEEITIKSTPVHQRGAKALFSSESKVIEKTSKVMKNLAGGIPAITVDAFSDSTIQLTIGSYQPPRSNDRSQDPSRMVRTPDRYVYTPRGTMLIPGRWVPAYYVPNYYLDSPYYSRYFYDPYGRGSNLPTGPGISTYFRSVLNTNNLAKVDSANASVILQDKVESFEEELKNKPEYATMYRYGDKLHYGYYDRKTKTFRIVEFAQNQRQPEAEQQQ